jgi:hypothetical protein
VTCAWRKLRILQELQKLGLQPEVDFIDPIEK